MKEPIKVFSVSLPEDLNKFIEDLAKKEQRSKTKEIVFLVKKGIEAITKEKQYQDNQ